MLSWFSGSKSSPWIRGVFMRLSALLLGVWQQKSQENSYHRDRRRTPSGSKRSSRRPLGEDYEEWEEAVCRWKQDSQWCERSIRLSLMKLPFAQGAMRLAFKAKWDQYHTSHKRFVIKISKRIGAATPEQCHLDAQMQREAQRLCGSASLHSWT